MKHLRKFNEELSPGTYLRTARKIMDGEGNDRKKNRSDRAWALKSHSHSIMLKEWEKLKDTVKNSFLELEDMGWVYAKEEIDDRGFFEIWLELDEPYVDIRKRDSYEVVGKARKGEISLESNRLSKVADNGNRYYIDSTETSDIFLTAVNRINGEFGYDFDFGYTNSGGSSLMRIWGRIY